MPKPSIPEKPSTVYICQVPRPKAGGGWTPDFSSAEKYGKLQFIFDMDDKVWADPTNALEKARAKLKEFDADHDFILWPGFCDPMALCVTLQVLMAGGNRMIRYLYWSRKRQAGGMTNDGGYYMPVEINDRKDAIRIA